MVPKFNQEIKCLSKYHGTSLVAQWLKNLSANAEDAGSIPIWGTKMPHATGQLSPHTATTDPMCSRTHAPE